MMAEETRKLRSVETGDVASFTQTAAGESWTPTVINPAKTGGMTDLVLFYVHILVWLVALVLSCIVNFGVGGFMSKNATYVACAVGEIGDTNGCGGMGGSVDYPNAWATDNLKMIGVLGGISSILGVLTLLGGAAVLDAAAYAKTVWLNSLVQFLTLFGTVSTFYIFANAAVSTESGFYWLTLFACIFCGYAQVLLYCTSAALDVLALPRAFIPSLASSVQLISAIGVSSGDFKHASGLEFTDAQKTVAWLVPVFTIISLVLMIGLRRITRDDDAVSQLGDRPFLRSIVLTPFLTGALLSVYKLSFVQYSTNAAAYTFGFLGMLLSFTIVGVVFVPSGETV